jgi:hypothetical protein
MQIFPASPTYFFRELRSQYFWTVVFGTDAVVVAIFQRQTHCSGEQKSVGIENEIAEIQSW